MVGKSVLIKASHLSENVTAVDAVTACSASGLSLQIISTTYARDPYSTPPTPFTVLQAGDPPAVPHGVGHSINRPIDLPIDAPTGKASIGSLSKQTHGNM